MTDWQNYIKVKHLFTQNEDHDSIQKSMTNIADVLSNTPCFKGFPKDVLAKFTNIPKGDDIFRPVDYANKLIRQMYDYADVMQIWIE